MEFKAQLIIYVALLALATVVVNGNRQEYQATVAAERARKVDDRGPPSCASDEMSFQLTLLLDNYSETSWEMKKVSDGSLVGAGAAEQYETPNTTYEESLCLTKGEYSFTIFDGWGDGLTQSATTGHYSGFLNNIEIFEDSDKEWFNETTTFTVAIASTPIACARDAIPFRLELLLDNYNETSWEMKKVSDGSVIIGEGSEDKYKKNTEYKETLCVTTGDYNFTIFDGYGDGLTQGAGHYSEFLDNIEIFSGKDFQKEETTTFTVVVDDPNRGTCENHETVDCARRASEKEKCTNNVDNTGKTVTFYCPVNCKSECAAEAPSDTPTDTPTDAPTKASTDIPADIFPSVSPSASPSIPPFAVPSDSPSSTPSSLAPTNAPTKAPTNAPTTAPTTAPTRAPTNLRTPAPTTLAPTTRALFPGPRTAAPTGTPTVETRAPFPGTAAPTGTPTFEGICFVADCDDIIYADCSQCREPSVEPTMTPTMTPTVTPTITPTMTPTFEPTIEPTTNAPTTAPTTIAPTTAPTTTAPTTVPTTTAPTTAPTSLRTPAPFPGPRTDTPTGRPSVDETECFLPNCDADPVPDCAQCRKPSRKKVPIIPIV